MRRTILHFIFYLLVLLSTTHSTKATENLGGELTYTWLSGNEYALNLTLYRDCSSSPADTVAIVKVSSTSCAISAISRTLRPSSTSPIQISPNCPGNLNSCQGGIAPGIEKWEYKDTLVLPGNCPDFIFTYKSCCRDTDITNIDAPGSQEFFISAALNNQSVSSNSSPIFSDPILFLQTGFQQTINYGIIDPEGDSLAYSLFPAMDSNNQNISYSSAFTYLNPIRSNPAMTIDSLFGFITVNPSNTEVDVLVMQINEYRNGVQIGNVTRDIKVTVVAGMNQDPTLSGANGSNDDTIRICAGETLRFMVYSADLDASDSTNVLPITFSSLPVNLSVFNAKYDSALVEAETDISMIRQAPYYISINVADNRCPFPGFGAANFHVYIDSCDFDIWPGDANVDLKCDLYDIFPIGLAYGSAGPIRQAATINWTADSTGNWSQDFIFGVNYKHADCNGDGLVDYMDTTAISMNYGLNHPDGISNPKIIQSADMMYLSASQDSAGPSETFSIDIRLGSSTNPVDSIYGIAFLLNFNPILVDSTQTVLSFLSSNLGTPGLDLLTFSKAKWDIGQIAAVAVRTDQNNSFSDTTIANLNVKIVNNIAANVSTLFSLSGIRGLTADGVMHFLNSSEDSIYVNINTLGLSLTPKAIQISLSPNPAQDEIKLVSEQSMNGSIFIYDLSGRMVLQTISGAIKDEIDISQLSNGIYVVGIKIDEMLIWKKLVVSR